jgi:GntR family transcriptional regulator, rspAB operon transcriptional repressor
LLRDDIYSSLRNEILTCALAPGSELREQELATRFGVSKSPVREALLQLEREKLVTVMPRQGYRVAPISLSDAHDMFGFRQVLELACIAEAARNANEAQLRDMNRYREFRGDDPNAFIEYNRDFHCALAKASGNARMARASCDLIEEMDRLVRVSVNAVRGRDPQKLVEEHGAIIDAVQARDTKAAVNLLKNHIRSGEKRLVTALEWAVVQA